MSIKRHIFPVIPTRRDNVKYDKTYSGAFCVNGGARCRFALRLPQKLTPQINKTLVCVYHLGLPS